MIKCKYVGIIVILNYSAVIRHGHKIYINEILKSFHNCKKNIPISYFYFQSFLQIVPTPNYGTVVKD